MSYKIKIVLFGGLLVAGGWLVLSFLIWPKKMMGSDARIICLTEEKLELVSVSGERNMFNRISFGGEVRVWIPGGLGWYPVASLTKLLEQEKALGKMAEVGFYNFGFWPDKLVVGENICGSEDQLLEVMGWGKWLSYKLGADNYLLKEEVVGESESEKARLMEILVRDMSESLVLEEEMRLGIVNNSLESGLGGMMGEVLEKAGMAVVSVESGEEEVEKCRVSFGSSDFLESVTGRLMKKVLDCQYQDDERVTEGEVEIYLGKGFAEMINYSSYN